MAEEKKEPAAQVRLKNVRVKYAKVIRPGKAYDDSQADEWSVNMYVTPEDRDALMAHGVNPKEDKAGDEYFIAKRSTKVRSTGADAKAPQVVDGAKRPFTDDIGNGSVCNIIVTLFPWQKSKTQKGVFIYLNAVQVVNHVAYGGGGMDFEVVEGEEDAF